MNRIQRLRDIAKTPHRGPPPAVCARSVKDCTGPEGHLTCPACKRVAPLYKMTATELAAQLDALGAGSLYLSIHGGKAVATWTTSAGGRALGTGQDTLAALAELMTAPRPG